MIWISILQKGYLFLCSLILKIEPKTFLYVPSKYSTTEIYKQTYKKVIFT